MRNEYLFFIVQPDEARDLGRIACESVMSQTPIHVASNNTFLFDKFSTPERVMERVSWGTRFRNNLLFIEKHGYLTSGEFEVHLKKQFMLGWEEFRRSTKGTSLMFNL